MTELCRKLIEEENKRRGKKYPEIGAITTFTRGFGLKDDLRIAEIVNQNGGVRSLCLANVRVAWGILGRSGACFYLDTTGISQSHQGSLRLAG